MAQIQLMSNKPDDALKSVTDAISLGQEMKDSVRESTSIILSAEVLFALRRPDDAVEAVELGLKMCKKSRDYYGEQYANEVLELVTGEPPSKPGDDVVTELAVPE